MLARGPCVPIDCFFSGDSVHYHVIRDIVIDSCRSPHKSVFMLSSSCGAELFAITDLAFASQSKRSTVDPPELGWCIVLYIAPYTPNSQVVRCHADVRVWVC